MKKLYKSFLQLKNKKFKYAVNKGTTMIPPTEKTSPIKLAGYLEKRSKMRVVCRWKKLWFVLEGRLLLYYKSQLEYLSLSPCRGTVNLGLAASVVRGKNNEIIVSTRSNTISLRALNRAEHEIWLHALLEALHLPNSTHTNNCCPKPVQHFRYPKLGENEHDTLSHGGMKSHNLTRSLSNCHHMESTGRVHHHPPTIDIMKDFKIDRLTRRFNRIASEISIPSRLKAGEDTPKGSLLQRSMSVKDEVNRYQENIYETVDSRIFMNKVRNGLDKRVIRSDSDCVMTRGLGYYDSLFRSEQYLRPVVDSPDSIIRRNILDFDLGEGNKQRQETPLDRLFKKETDSKVLSRRDKDIKSDTDLRMRKNFIIDNDIRRGTSSADFRNNFIEENHLMSDYPHQKLTELNKYVRVKKKNSFLRNNPEISHQVVSKKDSVKNRSLSFFKRLLKKKEPKIEEDVFFRTHQNDMQEIHRANSVMENASIYAVQLNVDYELPPMPEPPPDYESTAASKQGESETEMAPSLPPRRALRPISPPHDVPINNQPLDLPPALPMKKRKVRPESKPLDFLFEDSWAPGLRRLFQEESENELNEIMRQLTGLNNSFCQITSVENEDEDEDPDYDIPRPHASLLPDLMAQSYATDVMPPTNFFTQYEDSLDLIREAEEDVMAPDSLECYDSWSLNDDIKWIPEGRSRKSILASHYGLQTHQHFFEDSLNDALYGKDYVNLGKGYILHT